MLQWKRDFICGVVLFIFCLFNFYYAGRMSHGTIHITLAQPAPYLRMWLVLLTFFSVLLMVRALRSRKTDKTVKETTFVGTTFLCIGAMFLFLYLLPHLGFLLSSIMFLFITITGYSVFMWRGEAYKGKFTKRQIQKRICLFVVAAIIGGLLVEQLFRNVLNVFLPTFNLF